MSSNQHALWPWSPIVVTLVILNTTYPLQTLEGDLAPAIGCGR